jgi:outer membrane protein assembly factor BamB
MQDNPNYRTGLLARFFFQQTGVKTRPSTHTVLLAVFCVLFTCTPSANAQWSGFLGNQGNPVISSEVIPAKFKIEKDGQPSENIAWRRALPGRSVSGPIVVSDKVITTSSSAMEGRWGNTTAIDTKSGNIVWQRSIKTTGRPYCHPTSANAAPTPCTDGSRVFSFFSSNDLVCYDLDGNLQWFRSLVDAHPLAGNDVGMSSSPVVTDGVVVVCVDCQADSFIAGIDSQTGATLWEVPRPRKANWSSPVVINCADGKKLVVAQSGNNAIAIEPKTGKQQWELDEKCSTIASSAFVNGTLFLPAGGVKSYRIGNSSDKPTLEWTASRINPSSSSIAVLDSLGVLGLNRSVLVCCDFKGELKWQARLGEAGQFWSTPIVAGRRMFAADSKGKCFIVNLLEDKAEVVSECELGAEVLGSPAADTTGVYVRSTDALWKIQQL